MSDGPAKTWALTINNYTDNEWRIVQTWDLKKGVFAKEVGEDGTPHIQGHMTWPRAMRRSALVKLAPRGHWEVGKVDDFNYCLKTDTPIENVYKIDTRVQGSREDIAAAYSAVKARLTTKEFMEQELPGFQALRVFQLAKAEYDEPRRIHPLDVIYLYGPQGTGKDHWGKKNFPDGYETIFDTESGCIKWWSGYNGQKTIFMNDLRGATMPFNMLLKLLDQYPIQVNPKGGATVQAKWERVVITSCFPPEELYKGMSENIGQLFRRLTKIGEVPEIGLIRWKKFIEPQPIQEIEIVEIDDTANAPALYRPHTSQGASGGPR